MPHCLEHWMGGTLISENRRILVSCSTTTNNVFSMVFLAVCDARYCFSLVDVGEYGSNNYSVILRNSKIGKKFQKGQMNISESEKTSEDDLELPYSLVGEEIFPLQTWLMRPYSGKALSYQRKT